MSVDTHANKYWEAFQRHSRVLVQVGSRALREARRAASKSATSGPHSLRPGCDEVCAFCERAAARNRCEPPPDRPSVRDAGVGASATPIAAPGPTAAYKW